MYSDLFRCVLADHHGVTRGGLLERLVQEKGGCSAIFKEAEMKSLSLLKKTIAGGGRIGAIVTLSACTTIHPETISQGLGPEA